MHGMRSSCVLLALYTWGVCAQPHTEAEAARQTDADLDSARSWRVEESTRAYQGLGESRSVLDDGAVTHAWLGPTQPMQVTAIASASARDLSRLTSVCTRWRACSAVDSDC